MQPSPPQDPRLGVGRAVRRHLVVVLGLLVLVPVAAAVLVLGRATSYTSSTTVFLRPTIGNALSPDSAKNAQQVTVAMQTEAGLVNAPQVAALVSKKLHTTVEAGSSKVNASVPPNTQIVQIRYTSDSAESARAGTDAYATAFLAERKAVSDDSVKRQLQLLKDQATTVTANLRKVSADAASANPSPDSAALVQLYTNRLTNLQDLIGQLETTDTDPGSVVTPATTPPGRAPLSSALVLGVAAALGLLAGIALAVWRERADDRMRAADNETVAGVPLLARLPGVHSGVPAARERQALELSNGYRHARAAMLIALHERAVVAVAGADMAPAVPTSVIAANLAACLAGGRYNVGILDVGGAADAPSEAARVLGVTPAPVVLPQRAGMGGPRLDLIPRGHGVGVVTLDQAAEDDPGLFVSARFLELVTGLQRKFDIVIVAAPPLRSAHGTEICLAADGVMLAVTDRRTTRENVQELVTQQSRLRVPVLGLISVEPGRRRGSVSYDAIGGTSTGPFLYGDELAGAEPVAVDLPPTDIAVAQPTDRIRTERVPAEHRPPASRDGRLRAERARVQPNGAGRAPAGAGPANGRAGGPEDPPAGATADRAAEPAPHTGKGAGVDDETIVLRRNQVNAEINGKQAAGKGKADGHGAIRTTDVPTWFDRSESDN